MANTIFFNATSIIRRARAVGFHRVVESMQGVAFSAKRSKKEIEHTKLSKIVPPGDDVVRNKIKIRKINSVE